MSEITDVAVVGSGPSSALAAAHLADAGLRVVMLDVAHDDDRYRKLVPDLPFTELRHSDPGQHRYILSGGVTRRNLVPGFAVPLIRLADRLPRPIDPWMALHWHLTIRKR